MHELQLPVPAHSPEDVERVCVSVRAHIYIHIYIRVHMDACIYAIMYIYSIHTFY